MDEFEVCCEEPLVWVAGEARLGACYARLERCGRCEDARIVSGWDPPPNGWVGAMGRHQREIERKAVLDAFIPLPDAGDADARSG